MADTGSVMNHEDVKEVTDQERNISGAYYPKRGRSQVANKID